MKQGSQILPQEQQVHENQPERGSSWAVKMMIVYMYFAQGCIYSIAKTIPYVYINLPDYFTLSLFSLCMMPFALKFVTAPILQKYTNIQYGKRKTWIVINQTIVSLTLLLLCFYTGEDQQRTFALLLLPVYISISMQDISLDALCLKQLVDPKLMSLIQGGSQSMGTIFTGLVLLKGTSLEFAEKFGLSHPISNTRTILFGISMMFLIPTILIHFLFKQTQLETDEKATREPLLKVYGIYKNFFKIQYRYCRILIFFLLYHQGLNFFSAGYQYQLIKAGFSRDALNTIDNAQNFVANVLVFFFGMNALYFGFKTSFIIQISMLGGSYLIMEFFFPRTIPAVVIANFLTGLLVQWGGLLRSNLCAYFPEMGATGMIYTMNTSAANFGKNTFVHTAILKSIPWKTASLIGLAIQLPVIVFFIPNMMDLIDQGETSIEFQMSQTQGDGVRNENQLE